MWVISSHNIDQTRTDYETTEQEPVTCNLNPALPSWSWNHDAPFRLWEYGGQLVITLQIWGYRTCGFYCWTENYSLNKGFGTPMQLMEDESLNMGSLIHRHILPWGSFLPVAWAFDRILDSLSCRKLLWLWLANKAWWGGRTEKK